MTADAAKIFPGEDDVRVHKRLSILEGHVSRTCNYLVVAGQSLCVILTSGRIETADYRIGHQTDDLKSRVGNVARPKHSIERGEQVFSTPETHKKEISHFSEAP
jgi:hypothetical protein